MQHDARSFSMASILSYSSVFSTLFSIVYSVILSSAAIIEHKKGDRNKTLRPRQIIYGHELRWSIPPMPLLVYASFLFGGKRTLYGRGSAAAFWHFPKIGYALI